MSHKPPPGPDDLTDPESGCERARGWRAVDRIKDAGGCPYCMHRDRNVVAWGRSICSLRPALTFPKCLNTAAPLPERIERPGFQLDADRLYSSSKD